jgi:Zn-dependent peptidase ImmA (M78 family)/DNA-binding XRE family transcriptional regulator
MIGRRLQQIRAARNLSLEELAVKMGGIVTKQAISKYEHGKATPTPTVLAKLANVLGINASFFFTEQSIKVVFGAYRQSGMLLEKEAGKIKSVVECELENRVKILELLGQADGSKIPIQAFVVESMDDTEKAAEKLREKWDLGLEPIRNVTETLENRNICVINVEANENFDGISAKAFDHENVLKTVALVTRTDVDVVRQRLNLTHELGHLVLKISKKLIEENEENEEKAAFRFGAAFLAPAKKIIEDIGERRSAIQLEELFLLKRHFGLSIQSLLFRLLELGIIKESYYWNWFNLVKKLGWRTGEPEDWDVENSFWLQKNVLRLFAEGAIDINTVKRILGKDTQFEFPKSLISKQEFLKLPLEKRRKILAEQAEKVAKRYEEIKEEFEGGDLVEY